MSLAVLGVSHHTAPVEVRERFAFGRSDAQLALATLRSGAGVREAVLLSTCNRTELYLHPAVDRVLEAGRELLAGKVRGHVDDPAAYLYQRRDDGAVRHLFRVAAGLDSMIVGEAEIQGQVKDAYDWATGVPVDPAMTGPVLTRLFQMAFSVGGRVRAETSLGEGAGSVASVSVDLARKIFGSLRHRRVLILGAGATAELVVEALGREGVRGVIVSNRTVERAEELARRLQGKAVPFGEMTPALRDADIVVASTSAPHPVLSEDEVRKAFPDGPSKPLLIVDIAIPRDVEPSVAEVPDVFLYNIDDLQRIVDENLERRRKAIPRAEERVAGQVEEFHAWYASLEVVPVIKSLRERAEEVRRRELERVMNRLSHLGTEDRSEVEEFSRRLLNKLLHDPTIRLREGAADGRATEIVEAARFLYGLDEEGEESQDTPAETTTTTDRKGDE